MIEKIIYWVHRRLSPLKPALILSTLAITFFAVPANSQTNDREKLMAVMTVLNMYLLSDREKPIDPPGGPGMKIELGFGADQPLTPGQNETPVSGNQYFEFDLQDEGVELCFFIDSNSVINENDLVIEVNGRPQAAHYGENCVSVGRGAQRDINYINLIVNANGLQVGLSAIEFVSSSQSQLLLQRVTRGEWDEVAVRKVLKIFAFGGHATDEQIFIWSNMRPAEAILEMLNFSENNLKLSPLAPGEIYDDTESADQFGKLRTFAGLLSDPIANTPIPTDNRDQYTLGSNNLDQIFTRMATVRGLNPFRQRIGFWETNYHLAVNLDASVSPEQMAEYYDLIMEAHEAGLSYKDIIGIAAKSAGVAMQYGHRNNRWNSFTMECDCNDDFAREIHQLFYGIFGEGDPNHEDVTIPETAKMLTDMPVHYVNSFGFALEVDFQTDDHHLDPVLIFGEPVAGPDASAKIDALMPRSMQHPESLKNLPVMIISVLADDNLSESAKNQLRESWASMGVDRVLLDFIHAYAISALFHQDSNSKYLTSTERAIYLANKNNLSNLEAYLGGGNMYSRRPGRLIGTLINDDFAGEIFRPLHNVFGGQTSLEASDSALAFENNYNRNTEDERRHRDAVYCDTCNIGDSDPSWEKDWLSVLPQREDGKYYVEDVAAWLWNHVMGSMENYTELEKAHLYSLLGAARIDQGDDDDGDHAFDFNLVMCVIADYQSKESASDVPLINILTGNTWNDYCRYYDDGGSYLQHELEALNLEMTGDEILNNPTAQLALSQLAQVTLPFNATEGFNNGLELRRHALERVNYALAFIFTTPFVFAEGQ